MYPHLLHWFPLFVFCEVLAAAADLDFSDRVVYAVNCGGPRHVGEFGIVYEGDTSRDGTASDYGSRFQFINAQDRDRNIYMTERWCDHDFSYRVPVVDGNYVLLLKFSEVFFTSPLQKVFDVKLNGLTIIRNLDIFAEVTAQGFALDRLFDLSIENGVLTCGSQKVAIDRELVVTFAKGKSDNPKVNGLALLRGSSADIQYAAAAIGKVTPVDDPLIQEQEELEQVAIPEAVTTIPFNQDDADRRVASGPPTKNPRDTETDNTELIIAAVIACAFPVAYLIIKIG